MSETRSEEQFSVSEANIPTSSLVIEYSRVMGAASEGPRTLDDGAEAVRGFTVRSAENEEAGEKINNTESLTMQRRSSSEALNETARTNGVLHEEPLEIQCGEKTALLFVSKLCQGSKGPCILYNNEWLTPNELQYICGRETAKDWKRSIRHKGKSLKSLIAQGFLKVHPPICDCPGCRVSSPVNRSRLADKCGFSKIPSYLADKSMAEGFPTMWRRSSTSSDEPDQPNIVQGSGNFSDEESQPKRAHSDEPRYYRPSDAVHVAKRPRSSSPDLDRARINIKRRCMSETSAGHDEQFKLSGNEQRVKQSLSPPSHQAMEACDVQERKCERIDQEIKREQHRTTSAAAHNVLRRDLPVLTLPSSAYTANVIYGHNQGHLGLHRHVTSPRLLSPSFVRPASSPSAQIRLLHEQAVAPLSSHLYAQQLRRDYPNVGMATMFPYSFTHQLPSSQLLSSHFQKLTPELERHIASTTETSCARSNSNRKEQEKTNKEIERSSDKGSSPVNDALCSPKALDGRSTTPSAAAVAAAKENVKFANEEAAQEMDQETSIYPELAHIALRWDVDEVCKFVNSVTGCSEYCDVFREQEIDGQALILLTEEHLSNKMGIKLGPALKIKSKIDELRCVYTK